MFVCVSLVLLYSDNHYKAFSHLRNVLTVFTSPLQLLTNLPIESAKWLQERISSKETLITRNNELKQENFLLRYQLQQLNNLQAENNELRTLLNVAPTLREKVVVAKLLAVNVGSVNEQALIDKGINTHVFIGQSVLDSYGVIGQVIATNHNSSKVLFITDVNSAIPVVVRRNGLQLIAVGMGKSGLLELVNMPETADVKVGDQLITSGLGSRFVYGYSIGVVKSINRIVGERFAKVIVSPAAHIYTSSFVLLVWPKSVEHNE